MLKKRLIGVITVRNGWAVQSFGYSRHFPLGRPEVLAENLNRWGVDEILVNCIDRTVQGLGPDFALLKRLGALGLSTPLTYAGGVRSAADAGQVIQSGAERLCIDAVLHDDPRTVRMMAALIGAQAVIGAFPLEMRQGGIAWVDYRTGSARPLGPELTDLFTEGVISEAFLIDRQHEGFPRAFDASLVDAFPFAETPRILFGGLSEAAQIGSLLDRPRVAAVAVGNFLSYREHAVQKLKAAINATYLRPAIFAEEY